MPLFGQLNLQSVLARLPEMQDFETEPWELPGAEILQLSFEVGQERADATLPKAMHPAVPRYVTWVISHFPHTPVGPFHLAQLRLMGRAGVHPRYTFHRAERGRPVLQYLDEAAWHCEGFSVVHTIVGSLTTVDTDLPRIRFVMDREVPVVH